METSDVETTASRKLELEGTSRGNHADRRDMKRMGKKQELRRGFRFFSIWGYGVILGCSWEFALLDGVLSLPNGGTAGTVWMTLAACVGMFFVTLSMAEAASVAPTAGGQYHWCSEFAPKKYQKFLSYYVGFFCVLGWQSGLAATVWIAAEQVVAIIIVANPSYVVQSWHTALLSWAILAFAIIFNTLLFRKLPIVEGITIVFHTLGFFAFIIVLWVMAPHGDSSVVRNFDDNGWSSNGLACLVGLNAAIANILGADSSVHLSEELEDASWTLPRSMMAAALMNYVLAFITTITLVFCLGNYEDAINSSTGQPYVQVILNATKSPAATIVLTAVMVIMLAVAATNGCATSSRQLWSFARDQGLPFSSWLGQVNLRFQVPVNALAVSMVFTIILTSIAIGSTTAYTILLTLNISGLLSSYLICIACILYKRITQDRLPSSKFNLGKAGTPINLAAIAFLVVGWIFQFFPFAPNPTAADMNWSVVFYIICIIFFTIYYVLRARHRYTGPVALVVKLNESD